MYFGCNSHDFPQAPPGEIRIGRSRTGRIKFPSHSATLVQLTDVSAWTQPESRQLIPEDGGASVLISGLVMFSRQHRPGRVHGRGPGRTFHASHTFSFAEKSQFQRRVLSLNAKLERRLCDYLYCV